jgi:prophage maintenance system killer protein
MVLLELDQVLVVASHVLGCDAAAVVRRTDLHALEVAIADHRTAAEAGDTATAAAGLLRGLVRRRPFRGPNRTIAVAATLQLLALNGCDVELEPVDEIDALLDKVAADALTLGALADQLSLRIVPLPPSKTEGTPMFERFSRRARQAVVLAQEEARELGHDYIGTEHVLLGLVREDDGIAAIVLRDLGITATAIRDAVEEIVGRGKGSPSGHIPFTPRAKKVLELALREALQLGHNYIGTEHVLLGLVREGKGVAAQILVKQGAALATVRQAVIAELGESEPASSEARKDAESRLAGLVEFDVPSGIEIRVGRRKRLVRELTALFQENDRLRKEVDRLNQVLRDHGIDPAA